MSLDYPVTAAVRVLRQHGVTFTPKTYTYVDRGGTAHSAQALGVDEHIVVKTLIFEDETAKPLVVLQHGDRAVSTKAVAAAIGARLVRPCAPELAERHSGYLVGGTSPFGLKKPLPVYVERSILALPQILLNGGKRGFLVAIAPRELLRVLEAKAIEATTES
jgi:Cys-tRNA(Pro) deacylase